MLEWLNNLSVKDDMPLQEACVLTLCRLAKLVNAPEPTVPQLNKSPHRVSDEEEKNIILLRLVEYLGHTNPYVCAVAYNEVRDIQANYLFCYWYMFQAACAVKTSHSGDGKLTRLYSCPNLLSNLH